MIKPDYDQIISILVTKVYDKDILMSLDKQIVSNRFFCFVKSKPATGKELAGDYESMPIPVIGYDMVTGHADVFNEELAKGID